ncbi:MAG: nucleotidyl transferase AbiEii/AbiGii toxin family protein [Acidobacteriota bacterium]
MISPPIAPESLILDPSGALPNAACHLACRLADCSWAADLYLAGSAGLALHLRHRRPRHLDLMGWRRLRSAERRDLLADLLRIDPGVTVETARDGYLDVRFPEERWDATAVRLFHYPYPLIAPEHELSCGVDSEPLAVASAADLGAMKLGALLSRGARRDFVDLFLLSRRLPLETLLERAAEKFGHVRDFPLQALKALADREIARREPMPRLEVETSWDDVEAWIDGEVREIARRRLGLDHDATTDGTGA